MVKKKNVRREFSVWDYLIFDTFMLLLESLLYFVALSGPVWLLWILRDLTPLFLLMLSIGGYFFAAFIFTLGIISLRWLIVGKPEGRYIRSGRKVLRWSFGHLLLWIIERSPFMSLINTHILFRQLYYRGMGTKFNWTVYTASGVHLADPWGIQIGRHTLIGREAVIAGHKIERDIVTMEPVEIGQNVTIGARAHIQSGVKIGDGAVVGAEALIRRGTVIPPGTFWAGNPANEINPLDWALASRQSHADGD